MFTPVYVFQMPYTLVLTHSLLLLLLHMNISMIEARSHYRPLHRYQGMTWMKQPHHKTHRAITPSEQTGHFHGTSGVRRSLLYTASHGPPYIAVNSNTVQSGNVISPNTDAAKPTVWVDKNHLRLIALKWMLHILHKQEDTNNKFTSYNVVNG